jgi:hypothetical protein
MNLRNSTSMAREFGAAPWFDGTTRALFRWFYEAKI